MKYVIYASFIMSFFSLIISAFLFLRRVYLASKISPRENVNLEYSIDMCDIKIISTLILTIICFSFGIFLSLIDTSEATIPQIENNYPLSQETEIIDSVTSNPQYSENVVIYKKN